MTNLSKLDQTYSDIFDKVDWSKPQEQVEALRELVTSGHAESMNLLAILLGGVDSLKYRDEIVSLYEKAYQLGASTAAKNLSLQYLQWNEPFGSRIWERRSIKRGVS